MLFVIEPPALALALSLALIMGLFVLVKGEIHAIVQAFTSSRLQTGI